MNKEISHYKFHNIGCEDDWMVIEIVLSIIASARSYVLKMA